MYDHDVIARVTPLNGGNVLVYDLNALSHRTMAFPTYEPEARDIETVLRKIRRKRFGARPVANLAFQIPFSRQDNSLACWRELSGNQLAAPFDFSSSVWTQQNASIVVDDADSPDGVRSATRLIDASGGAQGLIFARAVSSGSLFSHQTKTALFTMFARADVSHIARIDIRANASPDLQVALDFWPGPEWRRVSVRNTFDTSLTANRSSWAFITPALNGTGEIHAWGPDLREISALTGRDEEILADFTGKCTSDGYRVDLSLDGGLTYREVELDRSERTQMKDKTIGHGFAFVFPCTGLIDAAPATLDGRW